MSILRTHRCGGTLHPRQVEIRIEEDGLTFQYPHAVPGFVCDRCREELVDRAAAASIDKNMTPMIWFTPEPGTSQTKTIPIHGMIYVTPGVTT